MRPATTLIAELGSRDGMRRQQARRALVKIGKAATPLCLKALKSGSERVRWEVVKALVSIKDPAAAPSLVAALMDDAFEIRWLAAEGLIALKRAALHPLLQALFEHADSIELRQGAHHVLHALEREGRLPAPMGRVLEALRSLDGGVSIVMAAERAQRSQSTAILR